MNVAAVAHARPASTKNCQAWRPSSFVLVEVSELIVEPLVHRGVFWRFLGAGLLRMLRPSRRDERDADDAEAAKQIRKDPRDAIESAIDRHRQEVLAAVFRDPLADDLIVALACVD